MWLARAKDYAPQGVDVVQPIGGAVIPRPKGAKYLSIAERLEVLSDIAHSGNRRLTNPVEAIREINRMTGAYPPTQHQIAAKVIFEVIYVDR